MGKKFSIIYADPCWRFQNWSSSELATRGEHWGRANGRSPYEVLDTKDIAALPVKKLAEKDCVLFCWATYPKLEDALYVIKEWGFNYKTVAFTWIKANSTGSVEKIGKDVLIKSGLKFGLGYWSRGNAEICLLATRGKPKRVSRCVEQVIIAPVGNHSSKPPETRDRIIELLGPLSRIELFARDRVSGWEATGLELDGMDIRDFLNNHNED